MNDPVQALLSPCSFLLFLLCCTHPPRCSWLTTKCAIFRLFHFPSSLNPSLLPCSLSLVVHNSLFERSKLKKIKKNAFVDMMRT
ncbi:hypothetical protein BKA57DRAFT_461260, partial [Linnemannia elongata]